MVLCIWAKMFMSYGLMILWSSVLLLLEGSKSQNPVLYHGNLPELNDVYYKKCAPHITCDPNAIYRTDNSSCNNLAHPTWGSSITPFIRLAYPVFDDGINKMRQKQTDGSPLPGPREIQLALFLYRSFDLPDPCHNVHLNNLGQWLTHDITHLPPNDLEPQNCCNETFLDTIPNCQTIIKVSTDDPVYGPTGQTCMDNIRVVTSERFNCDITPRIGMNQATPFLDASQLYGPTPDMPPTLRSYKGGKLKTDIINGREFCPQQQRNGSLLCDGRDNVKVCFLCGDPRGNQQFGITSYQTMFTRFHNVLTDHLHDFNQGWSDEKLYQESRKIMGAIHQLFAYRDYLPPVIGKHFMEEVGIALNPFERTIYNPLLMPQLPIEFSAAVFRAQHTITPRTYTFVDENYEVFDSVNLTDWMAKPDPLVIPHNFDGLIRGMTIFPGRAAIESYNFMISNFMFHYYLPGTGDEDLLCVDIERGRECGVPTFNTARQICGYPRAKTFMELTDILSVSDAMQLQNVYAAPDDVDFIVGVLLETKFLDAMYGPIGRCFMADAFFRLRFADRWFHDVKDQPGSFSDEQLEALRKIDLGLIICATTGLSEIPINILASLPSESMKMQSCEERLLNLNLSAWKV